MNNKNDTWSKLHARYKKQDWSDKPSLFAETAIKYFPAKGKVLDLGAGIGQDSQFFAEHGYDVTTTDLKDNTLKERFTASPDGISKQVTVQKVDLRQELPFDDAAFDVVYAHLSLHYFDHETTRRLFGEIQRVLKPGGLFAFFVNSIHDPEYNTGTKLEDDYFQIGDTAKRYFSVDAARSLTRYFDVRLLDDLGETYKDRAIGVHNLIRFIGSRTQQTFTMAIPYCGAIIEREHDGKKELLMQTRWKPHADAVYSGTFEFPAGVLDKPFEDVHSTLAREIKEETGLTLKAIKQDQRTASMTTGKDDAIIGFRPFCCTQQLKNGKPWIGFVFVCEVESGQQPIAQLSETKDVRWMKVDEVKALFETSPEKLFGLELPAWHYYFAKSA